MRIRYGYSGLIEIKMIIDQKNENIDAGFNRVKNEIASSKELLVQYTKIVHAYLIKKLTAVTLLSRKFKKRLLNLPYLRDYLLFK
jgi:hypothetical protein